MGYGVPAKGTDFRAAPAGSTTSTRQGSTSPGLIALVLKVRRVGPVHAQIDPEPFLVLQIPGMGDLAGALVIDDLGEPGELAYREGKLGAGI